MRRRPWPAYPVLLFALAATLPSLAQEVDLDDLKPAVVPPVSQSAPAAEKVSLRGSPETQAPQPVVVPDAMDNQPVSLFLEVYINGQPRNWIAEFRPVPGGFSAQARELREIGLEPPSTANAEDWVALASLPGATSRYDEALQRIHIDVADAGMTLTRYNDEAEKVEPVKSGPGAYLNYSLNGGFSHDSHANRMALDGFSALGEAWAFNDFGVAHSSFLATAPLDGKAGHVRRLDTFLRRDDIARQMSFQVGDAISGGLSWTRPIRLGGVQIRRNFDTRPDLIRQPLPSFRGSAAVPSTVDVVAGNVTLSSTRVEPGRFEIANIAPPIRNGTLDVVVRGEGGTETRYALPFGTTDKLLRPGLTDFSVEAGFPRIGFGTDDDDYLMAPVFIASLRRGLTDTLTGSIHAEANENLVNGGFGAVVSLGRYGTFDGAVAVSHVDGREGTLISAGYSVSAGQFAFSASTRQRMGDYLDLADVTSVDFTDVDVMFLDRADMFNSLSASYRSPHGNWSLSAGYAHTRSNNSDAHLGTLTFTNRFSDSAYFNLRGQSGLGDLESASVFAGLTMLLGTRHSTSAGMTATEDSWLATTSIAKSSGGNVGETGYQATIRSDGDTHSGIAQVNHATRFTDLRGTLSASEDRTRLSAQAHGSFATIGGEAYAGRRIDSAFAVVNAGAPGVAIRHQNRLVGKTGRNGKLLVTGLPGFDESQVSVDPNGLPLGSAITQTRQPVRIARNKGARVAFDGAQDKRLQVTLSLLDAGGKPLPVGAPVRSDASEEESIVGYDGQTFLAVSEGVERFTIEANGLICPVDLTGAEFRQRLVFVESVVCR